MADVRTDARLSDQPSAAVPAPRPRSRRRLPGRIGFHTVALAVAAFFLFPIYWALASSVKDSAEANASPPTLVPRSLAADNYTALADYGIGIGGYIVNTLIVCCYTVVGTLLLGVLAGYGFARFRFRGQGLLFVLILVIFMVPYPTIVLPLYLLLDRLGLLNTHIGLSILIILFQLPFAVFMMRNSFDSIPRELEDAALVDGCGPVKAFRHVSLRLVMPGVVTVGLFAFLAAWNDFFGPLIFLTDGDKFTLPVMLVNVRSGEFGTVDYGALHAGIIIAVLPCAVLFLALQRFYVNGLVAGAVKA